ncbi:MAG TPA: NifU family protein [Steroidobacteraceae bacterium]|nr:NifU family protein [Steroidobacteraceae bacterium]
MKPALETLAERLAGVNMLMQAHAGGVELVEVDRQGAVLLRFSGKCTGCELRPLTLAATIRPALLSIPGVRGVSAVGTRISEEAERRLAQTLSAAGNSRRVARLLAPLQLDETGDRS